MGPGVEKDHGPVQMGKELGEEWYQLLQRHQKKKYNAKKTQVVPKNERPAVLLKTTKDLPPCHGKQE